MTDDNSVYKLVEMTNVHFETLRSQPIYTFIVCHRVNTLIQVIYQRKFNSNCQSHSDDSINLKGLCAKKHLFFVYFSFILHPHY